MPDPTPGRSEHGPAPEHGPASEPGPVSEGSAPPPGTGSERAPNPGSPDTNAEEKSDTVPGNPPTVGSAGDARSRRRVRIEELEHASQTSADPLAVVHNHKTDRAGSAAAVNRRRT